HAGLGAPLRHRGTRVNIVRASVGPDFQALGPPGEATAAIAPKPLVSPRGNRYVCARAEWPTTPRGEVAEWLNAPHSKCGLLARVSGVRIPPFPDVTHCSC